MGLCSGLAAVGAGGLRIFPRIFRQDRAPQRMERGKGNETMTNVNPQRAQALFIATVLVEQIPAVPIYQISLGGSYFNYGVLIRDEGQPANSLEWFDLAIRTLNTIQTKEPRDIAVKWLLWNCHQGRAQAYDQLHRPVEAVKDWDRAIELSPPTEQPKFRTRRATSQLQAGMVVEAMAEVAELSKIPNGDAGQWYNFACVYAVASDKIADKKQEYADRAMEMLQQAVKAGFTGGAHMAKDTDLDPLRDREDFQKLLDSLPKPQPIGSSKS